MILFHGTLSFTNRVDSHPYSFLSSLWPRLTLVFTYLISQTLARWSPRTAKMASANVDSYVSSSWEHFALGNSP